MTDPNSANPTISPTPLVTANTRLPNSRGGSTGSAARRSACTNATVSTIAATPSPIGTAEIHLYEVPPSVHISTSALRAAASRPAPT